MYLFFFFFCERFSKKVSSSKGNSKWSNEKTLQFIELYRDKSVLWDPKNSNYYNKFSKNNAWEELATVMAIESGDCKLKINSLQSSLRREKSRIKRSHETGTGNSEAIYYYLTYYTYIFNKIRVNQKLQRNNMYTYTT